MLGCCVNGRQFPQKTVGWQDRIFSSRLWGYPKGSLRPAKRRTVQTTDPHLVGVFIWSTNDKVQVIWHRRHRWGTFDADRAEKGKRAMSERGRENDNCVIFVCSLCQGENNIPLATPFFGRCEPSDEIPLGRPVRLPLSRITLNAAAISLCAILRFAIRWHAKKWSQNYEMFTI